MTHPSRRLFLMSWLGLPLALVTGRLVRAASPQGLGQFTGGGPPPCTIDEKATPAAPEGPDFKAKSPARSSLLEPGMGGTTLVLTGTVSGLTCGPIKQAMLDFWQADARGAYDSTGFRLRGHQATDATGNYRLETIMPGASGAHAPQIHVKVQPPGKPVFTSQLFFPDQPRNKTDPQFRSELLVKFIEGRGSRSATFNIVLDI